MNIEAPIVQKESTAGIQLGSVNYEKQADSCTFPISSDHVQRRSATSQRKHQVLSGQ